MNIKFLFLALGVTTVLSIVLGLISLIPIFFIFLGFNYGVFLLLTYYLFNLLFLIDLFFKKRVDIQSKISWILVFLFLPGAGAFLYLLYGFVPFKTRDKLEKLRLENSNFPFQEKGSFEDLKLIKNGNNKLKNLLSDLKKAKEFIHIQYFIINNGITWKQIEEVLLDKLKNGIKVRITIDYFGNIQTKNSTFDNIKKAGAEVLFFNKNNFLLKSGLINYRNHNKFVIIDDKISYFGGMNIGDDYSGLYSKYGFWFDLQFRFEGEISKLFNNQFKLFFNYENSKIKKNYKELVIEENLDKKGSKSLEVLYDGPQFDKTTFLDIFVNKISQAKKSIKIVTPYVVLPKVILDEIEKASYRGVKIDLITCGIPDKKSAFIIGKSFSRFLQSFGVNIYRINDSFVHSKFFIFDDNEVIFGTSNLDYRAIYLHFETNLVLKNNQEFLDEINSLFNDYIKNSSLVDRKNITLNFFEKIKFKFLKIFAPIF